MHGLTTLLNQNIQFPQDALLPSGEKLETGSSIFIQSVKREHAGMFVCMADNAVGNQATANINLTVMRKSDNSVLVIFYN